MIDPVFFYRSKVQLVIDGHTNKKQDIKMKILQQSQILSIFFLVYIIRVF